MLENIKIAIKTNEVRDPLKVNRFSMSGKMHQDLHSQVIQSVGSFDLLNRLAEVEEALVKKILSYCTSPTIYSLRLVSKLWMSFATTWFLDQKSKLLLNWTEGIPSKEVFECQSNVSAIAVDDFSISVGLENGKVCVFNRQNGHLQLMWVAHGGLVTSMQICEQAIFSSGLELNLVDIGRICVWSRDTGSLMRVVKAPIKAQLKFDDAFSSLLVKEGFLFAMGIEKDVWIWNVDNLGYEESSFDLELNVQFRLAGHYSTVLCCDMDSLGNIMTGSRDAQVRLWKLGIGLGDRSNAVACHNQHGNPITAVSLLWPLGMSASSGSVRLYHHPSGACLRTFRFSKYVYDMQLDCRQFVTSEQVCI